MEYKQATLVNWRNEDEDEEKKQQTYTRSNLSPGKQIMNHMGFSVTAS